MNAQLLSICMLTLTKQHPYIAMLGVVRDLHAVTSALTTWPYTVIKARCSAVEERQPQTKAPLQ
jgi:hypothetical protein